MFVVQQRTEGEIAALLNGEGLTTDTGRPWTRGTVHQVLTNEKNVGNDVFNRDSNKLKARRVLNPPDMWVRADRAVPAIVETDFFAAAPRVIGDRNTRFRDQDLP